MRQGESRFACSARTKKTRMLIHRDLLSECLHTLHGHTSTIRCLKVLDGRPVAVSGARDASLRVWDIEKGTSLHYLIGHTHSVRCIEIAGHYCVSGSYDCTARVSCHLCFLPQAESQAHLALHLCIDLEPGDRRLSASSSRALPPDL